MYLDVDGGRRFRSILRLDTILVSISLYTYPVKYLIAIIVLFFNLIKIMNDPNTDRISRTDNSTV